MFNKFASCIDVPRPLERIRGDAVSIAGWFFAKGRDPSQCVVRARLGDQMIGETRMLFVRKDVTAHLKLAPDIPTGFRILALMGSGLNEKPGRNSIAVTACWSDGGRDELIGTVNVEILDSGNAPYSDALAPTQTHVLHRQDIYGSGPPVDWPSEEALQILHEYLPPGTKVVDVGCGSGAYGPSLLAAGFEWIGIEVNPQCIERLTQRGLPHRQAAADSDRMPCDDGEFEAAVCIEVLEHIERYKPFLAEIARAVRRRAIFSVPNMEVIPHFSAWSAVPWHLLEADHKNFFTRASLRDVLREQFRNVEVFSYARHPLSDFAGAQGATIHSHLMAIADK